LQHALSRLPALLLDERTLLEVLHDVAGLAAAAVPDVEEVSLTLVEDDQTGTVAFTGALAADLDERQYGDGFGPALAAGRSGTVVRIDDTAAEQRFPEFADVARRRGVTSVLALGLPMPSWVVGGLSLYRVGADEPVSAAAEQVAAQFATAAAPVLAAATREARQGRRIGHLQAAAVTRGVIDQAKGIIMGRRACDAEEAFGLLVAQSQRSNRKLRDLAADIVADAVAGRPPPHG